MRLNMDVYKINCYCLGINPLYLYSNIGILKDLEMHLNMYINDVLIDSVEINVSLLNKLNLLKQQLEEKHLDIIDLSNDEPEYYIDGLPSRVNLHYIKKII